MLPLKILFLSAFVFCFGLSKSQDKWRAYISDTTLNKSFTLAAPDYYLLRSNKPIKKEVIDSLGFTVIRQLDAQNSIVKINNPSNIVDLSPEGLHLYRANQQWKLNSAYKKVAKERDNRNLWLIKVTNSEIFKNEIVARNNEIKILHAFKPSNTFLIKTPNYVVDSLLSLSNIIYVEVYDSKIFEEAEIMDFTPSVNHVNQVNKSYPEINGQNITVSVKENRYDTTDIDFKSRHIPTTESAQVNSEHSTFMASIIAGGGNQSFKSKGIAWGANLASSDFNYLLPNSNEYFTRYGISVQNHSYGTQIENFYGAYANAYDVCSNQNPLLMHVFSAGNSGQQTDTAGLYKDIPKFANFTGNYKQAKNCITVGACDLYNLFDTIVSRGPAYDGRIKPELVAFSISGSSNAAAIASGVAALMQQTYKLENNDSLPAAALLKAILINSADDIGKDGIDFYTGYGNINAYRAIQNIKLRRFISGKINKGEEKIHEIFVPANARNLKITLVWNDPAAQPGSSKALINDLDLILINKKSGIKTKPWCLNPYPNIDSLSLPAIQKADHLNNVEQISLSNPESGAYQISISAFDLPISPQDYYIAYQWEEDSYFQWTYPVKGDFMINYLPPYSIFRWKYTGTETYGSLEVKFGRNSDWKLISNNIDLSKGYYKWTTPSEITSASVRMNIGNESFVSDTFTISDPLSLKIGFNCGDSVMLVWNKPALVKEYKLYNLGEKYMETVASLSDTFIIIKKNAYLTNYFAVSPVLDHNLESCRSFAYNYNVFGLNCYFLGFVAENMGSSGIMLSLSLGSTYKVKKVNFEHWEAGFVTFACDSLLNSSNIATTHNNPTPGLNVYRASMELDNGKILYTPTDTVYYIPDYASLVFPNPARSGDVVKIYMPYEKGESATIIFYDLSGKAILSDKFISDYAELRLPEIKKGIYIYKLLFSDFTITGKLIIY